MIPNFTLTGSSQSRKNGLATFVHNKLSWTLVDQFPDESTIEWLCIDVDRYKIVNIYKPPLSQLTPTAIPVLLWMLEHQYQPRLGLVSINDRCFHDRRVLERFPRSQHRPSLITTPKIVVSVPSEPYK